MKQKHTWPDSHKTFECEFCTCTSKSSNQDATVFIEYNILIGCYKKKGFHIHLLILNNTKGKAKRVWEKHEGSFLLTKSSIVIKL